MKPAFINDSQNKVAESQESLEDKRGETECESNCDDKLTKLLGILTLPSLLGRYLTSLGTSYACPSVATDLALCSSLNTNGCL